MNAVLDVDAAVELWLGSDLPPEVLSIPLPDAIAAEVVERLKQEADRYWYIDPNRSLEYAERIIAIGHTRNDTSQIALGLMARGDALKYLGRMEEAWKALEQAGNLYRGVNDEVGWARTRIGRLPVGLELNCVSAVLADAEEARGIFERQREDDKLLRLYWEVASLHLHRGDSHLAREFYHLALQIANQLGESGQGYLGWV